MPFIPHTPESLLPRSDSKNPAATCGGITASGRPCRRAIPKSPQSSPSPALQRLSSPEAFCFQHREQASAHNSPTPSPQRKHQTIKERTSVDTLVDRLGLLEVEQKRERKQRPTASQNRIHEKLGTDSSTANPAQDSKPPRRHPTEKKKSSSLLFLCCIGEEDDIRVSATRPINKQKRRETAPIPLQKPARTSRPLPPAQRPALARDPSSRTGEFLSLIPPATSPQTTALLLSELAKPFSELDDDGFIYMFWLTRESMPAEPPSRAASDLLTPPIGLPPSHRRTSDVLNTFAAATPDTSSKKTMLLKIGRAQNVQRRLNQWTRQCGYNVSLIRYYPYHSTTPAARNENMPPSTPRKVPNVNKVERLIHLELGPQKAKGTGRCGTCGREHREWFEVEASRNGVKAVDEVIRRWVEWGEREATPYQ